MQDMENVNGNKQRAIFAEAWCWKRTTGKGTCMELANELQFEVAQTVGINAPIERAYDALLRRLTTENATPDNRPMPMSLEPWPGGRWFRDLGNNQGHWWGFVQVIKPPSLLEIHGPTFMSYAVAGHLQFRLTAFAGHVELMLRHRVLGFVEESHRQGIVPGWNYLLQQTKLLAEQGTP